MSKLDDILANGTQLYEAGKHKIVWSSDPVKQQVKALMLEITEEVCGDEEYGELAQARVDIRQKVEEL